jgi:hypothetical protein
MHIYLLNNIDFVSEAKKISSNNLNKKTDLKSNFKNVSCESKLLLYPQCFNSYRVHYGHDGKNQDQVGMPV